jgi:methylaspartate mutase sigma subunit
VRGDESARAGDGTENGMDTESGEPMGDKTTIVTGVIGSDVHIIGNKILSYALTEAGFNVISLGIFVTQEDLIKAAIETAADAILVSSLGGHGEIECRGLRDKCTEAGLKDIIIYVGGNLCVGKIPWETIEKTYLAMGMTRVFGPDTMPEDAIGALKEDLGLA